MLAKIFDIIFYTLFIFINEMFGPYALLSVINNYLETITVNHPILADNRQSISKINEGLAQLSSRKELKANLISILFAVETLPDAGIIDPTLRHLTNSGEWKMFLLYGFGKPVLKNIEKRLEIAHMVHSIKDLWHAHVSALKGKSRINFHRAITKGLLRYMFPIQGEGLYLEFYDDVAYEFEEDQNNLPHKFKKQILEPTIYDPLYMHSIINESENWSLFLIIDFVRPLEGFANSINRLSLDIAQKHPMINDAFSNAELQTLV